MAQQRRLLLKNSAPNRQSTGFRRQKKIRNLMGEHFEAVDDHLPWPTNGWLISNQKTKPEKGEAKENFQRNRVKKELTLPRSRRRTRINQESAGFVRGLWTNGKGNGNGDRKVKGWAKKRRRKATGRGRRARRNGRWECQGLRVWELLVPQSVTRCCPAGARYHRHHGRRSREA
jgi:hypothetical protein